MAGLLTTFWQQITRMTEVSRLTTAYEIDLNVSGLSPDGGDGSWEIAALVLLVGFGTVVGLLLPIARKPNGTKPLD